MNFLLAGEDAEKHVGTKSCFYCNKVFNNYRALGGHLRIHQEERTSRTFNYPGRSSNSPDITRNASVPLPNSQLNSSGGGDNPIPFTRAPPSFDFSMMFCPNETNQASKSRFIGSNPGVAQAQVLMSPDLSNGCGSGTTYHHQSVASRAFAPPGANAAMSAAFTSSSSVVATGFPIDPSLYLGSNGVCQFNTDEFHVSQDGLPPSSGDALQNIRGYDLGRHALSSLDDMGQYDRTSLLTCEESKRPYVGDEPQSADEMNASKKPKIASAADVEVEPDSPQLKELSLFLDVDGSITASETCGGAEEAGPADLDLSLHL